MVKVLKQEQRLLVEGALDLPRCFRIAPLEANAADKFHQTERLALLRFNFLVSL